MDAANMPSRPALAYVGAQTDRIQDMDSRNWFHYQLFLRQDFDACSVAFDASLVSGGLSGGYNLFLQGLIAKRKGNITEAMKFFKAYSDRNPRESSGLTELVRLSYLSCAYGAALGYAEKAKNLQADLNSILLYEGLCHEKLGQVDMAESCLKSSVGLQPVDKPYIVLSEFYVRQNQQDKAVEILERAKRIFPDSIPITTKLAYLQLQNPRELETVFGNLAQAAGSSKKRDDEVLLALGSLMQRQKDLDGALKKYETIIRTNPENLSADLLNNIGLCYFAKMIYPGKKPATEEEQKHRLLVSIGCLNKAHQLAPMDPKITSNLGYVMRMLHLFASGSYFLMGSIKLTNKGSRMNPYLLLAGVAQNLEIPAQANQLYRYCIKHFKDQDPVIYLNYALFLLGNGQQDLAAQMGTECLRVINEWRITGRAVDQSVLVELDALRNKITIAEPGLKKVSSGQELVVTAQVEPSSVINEELTS